MLVPEWFVKGGITNVKLRPGQDEVFLLYNENHALGVWFQKAYSYE